MSENIVTHPGFVKSIEQDKVEIAIISIAGCASCQIKGSCSVSDVEEKQVWVNTKDAAQYKIGQQVTVEMKQSLGTWAVLLGYVFPFLILMLSLVVFVQLGLDQGLAGILSLMVLVPYYFLLYFTRHWLGKRFQYRIRI